MTQPSPAVVILLVLHVVLQAETQTQQQTNRLQARKSTISQGKLVLLLLLVIRVVLQAITQKDIELSGNHMIDKARG